MSDVDRRLCVYRQFQTQLSLSLDRRLVIRDRESALETMCIQLVERYATCKCVYYRHAVDSCQRYRENGHEIESREVFVGNACSRHTSSSVYRSDHLQPRRGHAADSSSGSEASAVPDTALDASASNNVSVIPVSKIPKEPKYCKATLLGPDYWRTQSRISYRTEPVASLGPIDTRRVEIEERRCPYHPRQTLATCPHECRWEVEFALERGFLNDTRNPIEVENDQEMEEATSGDHESSVPGTVRTRFAFLYGGQLVQILQSSTRWPEPSTALELEPLRSLTGRPTSGATPQLEADTDTADNVGLSDESESVHGSGKTSVGSSYLPRVRPCYLLVLLGVPTVIGSLAPALWRSSARHDLSGGFALAQYILGVGVFVVGSVAAVHSRTCTCWQS